MNIVSYDTVEQMIQLILEKIECYRTSHRYISSVLDENPFDSHIICIPHLTYITLENLDRFIQIIKRDVKGIEVEPIITDCINDLSFDYLLTISQEDSDERRTIKAFGFMCIPSKFGYTVGYSTYERDIELSIINLSKGLIKKLQFEDYVKFYTAEAILKLLEKKMSAKTI